MQTLTRGKTPSDKYLHWQVRIRAFIRTYSIQHGYSPTIREIQEALGASSTSVVIRWLRQMKDNGQLDYSEGEARTFRLPGQRMVFDE